MPEEVPELVPDEVPLEVPEFVPELVPLELPDVEPLVVRPESIGESTSGGYVLGRDDVIEVTRLLDAMGVDVHLVAPLGASPADIKTIGAADFSSSTRSSARSTPSAISPTYVKSRRPSDSTGSTAYYGAGQ